MIASMYRSQRCAASGWEQSASRLVTKSYPAELHRQGAFTARDHEVGLYDLHDRVQVKVNNQWIDGEVTMTRGLEYEVQLPPSGRRPYRSRTGTSARNGKPDKHRKCNQHMRAASASLHGPSADR
jgi:hypothetical protein